MNVSAPWWQRWLPLTHPNPSLPRVPKPTWCLGYGAIDTNLFVDRVVWRDEQFAVTVADDRASSVTLSPVTLSPSERFVLVGDVWLPDRLTLMQQWGLDRPLSGTRFDAEPPSALAIDRWLIAQLWEQQQTDTWKSLSGAFALAVWDRERQMLWLGRDRVGSRTLYYTTDGTCHWVAPQLRTLTPHCSADVDLVALRDYLCCAFVPGERTLYQHIREVRPGTYIQLPTGTVQVYWQLREQLIQPEQPLEWHGDRVRSLLNQIVQAHLPADKPVGVFLSGGLDSSCVTALAATFHNAPIHTYSIHFGEACPNELEFSSLVAQHCQTQHHILEITFKDMWEHLPETMAALDDPIGDPLTVPNLLLGRLAATSVSVVLNGEGGDPCFGGPKNQPMLINALYDAVAQQDSLQAYLASFQKCAADLPQLLKPEIWSAVRSTPSVFSNVLQSSDRYLNRLMALNIQFKGADQILTKVNNLTYAAGIEGRSPLFDPRLVALSMTMPPEYKLSGVQEKAVLKQAVADLLPASILQRPKSGMMVPVQLGFRQHWNRQARALLLSRHAAIAPYLNQTLIRDWLDYNGDTWGRYGVKLWLLVSLEYWLQGR